MKGQLKIFSGFGLILFFTNLRPVRADYRYPLTGLGTSRVRYEPYSTGTVWYSKVQNWVVLYGTVWYGVVWYGIVCNAMV